MRNQLEAFYQTFARSFKNPRRSFKTAIELSPRELHSMKRSSAIARRT